MNFINKLQTENEALKGRIKAMEEAIIEFRQHLQTPKFTAPSELQGYISTGDVERRLIDIYWVGEIEMLEKTGIY